jgi:starch synthase
MKVLMAASEVVGFAKTGGLADVVGSLPRALQERGHDCVILLPLHHSARGARIPPVPTEHQLTIPVGDRRVSGRLWRSALPDSSVPVYLVEQNDYFDRDDQTLGRGLYQYTLSDGSKRDYSDNGMRFIFFSRAVLEALPLSGFWPDVIHCHDWQTGLVPVYLREMYRRRPDPVTPARYAAIRTLFTIHNIAYQGVFWHWEMTLTGLDQRLFNYRQLEFHGQVNFLKAGIVFSDLINTVSPTYAKEIQTPYFGAGLQGVLAERRQDLSGIVNGVDYGVWDPASDRHIEARYDVHSVTEGKPRCKKALQHRCGLPERPGVPLLGMVARLVDQKGLDILGEAADRILGQGVQLVVLGEGAEKYHHMLKALRGRHPDQVSVRFGFDESLAHEIEAGADIFLMPSLYEPSGLNQLYSMRYGTPPVVRATGGLADTVIDCTPATLASDTATGFRFIPCSCAGLLDAVHRAVGLYRGLPDQWLRLMRAGMRQDWSWQRSAREYEQLYARMVIGDR